MTRVYGNPFKLDWTNRGVVIDYAKKLGKGQAVIKFPDRKNYNIAHSCRLGESQYANCTVVFKT